MFNFHHHHKVLCPGIYNLNSKNDSCSYFFSAGIHPANISCDWEEDFAAYESLFSNKKCLAVGECGLDARIDTPHGLQEKVFRRHIAAANELYKPVIIHCVRRYNEILTLKKYAETPWILHGFRKNKTVASQLLAAGFYLSFGEALLHDLSLQEIFAGTPSERIFLETDDAETNISAIYRKAAAIRNTTVEILQNQIINNLAEITNAANLG